MQRLWNLNWENITYDHDISGLMRGLIDWGVIEGGTVVGNKLQPVQAIVPLVRSNGQKILAFFESDEVIDLPTTGDYKVYIEVDQSKIDFGGNNAEDGTGIASIKTWPTLPSQNFLLLASVTAGQVKDERNLIPKVGQIAQRTTTLESKVEAQGQKVGKLEEAGVPDHLGKNHVLWDPLQELLWWYSHVVNQPTEPIKYFKIDKWAPSIWVYYIGFIYLYDENDREIPRTELINPARWIGERYELHLHNGLSVQSFKTAKRIKKITWERSRNDTPYKKPQIWVSSDNINRQKYNLDADEPMDNTWYASRRIVSEYTEEEKQALSEKLKSIPHIVYTQNQEDARISLNIWDTEDNALRYVHVIGSGQEWDTISLPIQKIGQPTTAFLAKIKKANMQWFIAGKNNLTLKQEWSGIWVVLAEGKIAYTKIADKFNLIEIKLNKKITLEKGKPYLVELSQEWDIVNSANYYQIACDSSQISDTLGSHNKKEYSKFIPYIKSGLFASELLIRETTQAVAIPQTKIVETKFKGKIPDTTNFDFFCSYWWTLKIKFVHKIYGSSYNNNTYNISYIGWLLSYSAAQASEWVSSSELSVVAWDLISISVGQYGSTPIPELDIIFEYTTTTFVPRPQNSVRPLSLWELGAAIQTLTIGSLWRERVSENKVWKVIKYNKLAASYSNSQVIDTYIDIPSSWMLVFGYDVNSWWGATLWPWWIIIRDWNPKQSQNYCTIPVQKWRLPIRCRLASIHIFYFSQF